MAEAAPSPFSQTVSWLATHTRFPASRLPDKAELLVLIATAAANEDLERSNPYHVGMLRNPNFAAQIRNYTAQRRKVHIKSDNSAKT
jgi:hypothetical protein